jgi:hypothetical protein
MTGRFSFCTFFTKFIKSLYLKSSGVIPKSFTIFSGDSGCKGGSIRAHDKTLSNSICFKIC